MILHGDSLTSMNTLNDTQVKESPCSITLENGVLYADIKKLSFYEFIIPLA